MAQNFQFNILLVSSFFNSTLFSLNQLLHVPLITKNLIIVSKFAKENHVFFEFYPNFFLVKYQVSKTMLLEGRLKKGLYAFDANLIKSTSMPSPNSFPNSVVCISNLSSRVAHNFVLSSSSIDCNVWHNRLDYPSSQVLKSILDSCNIPNQNKMTFNFYLACCVGKMHKFSSPLFDSQYSKPLLLVHTNLWDPSPSPSLNGYQYYIHFVEVGCLLQFYLDILRNKSDVFQTFLNFESQAELQLGTKLKAIQLD